MSKVSYTECDVCGKPINSMHGKFVIKNEAGRNGFEFTRKLDICSDCWHKIHKYIEENKNVG